MAEAAAYADAQSTLGLSPAQLQSYRWFHTMMEEDNGGKEDAGGKKEDGWYQDSNGEWVYGSKEDDSGSKGDTGKVCKEEWEQNSDGDWVNCYTGEVWEGGK